MMAGGGAEPIWGSWALRRMHQHVRFLFYQPAGDGHDSPQVMAAYRQWAWDNYHAKLLRVWAFILIIQIVQYQRDIKNIFQRVQVYVMIILVATIAVLTFCRASVTTAHWASRALVTFSVVQATTTIHIAFEKGAPAGCLALADFQVKDYLCHFLLHMLAGVPFHMKILGYRVPMATLKALFMQASPLVFYALLERTKCATFMRHVSCQGAQRSKLFPGIPVKPAPMEEPAKPHSLGHACAPPVSDQDAAMGEGVKPIKYVSPLRRVKAHVKLKSSLKPEDLSEEAVKQLPGAAASSLKDCCLVNAAIRHGCIVLSIDVCELQAIAQEQLGDVSDLTQQALLKWLEKSGLEQQLQHGSTLVIQVEGHTWNCSWDGHAQAWSVDKDANHCSAFGLSVPAIALFMPPALPPSHTPPYAPLTFDVCITAPSAFHLVGWQEPQQQSSAPKQQKASEQQEALKQQSLGPEMQQSSAPEQQEASKQQSLGPEMQQSSAPEQQKVSKQSSAPQQQKAPKQPAGSLQLLAHTCGRFLPVSIQHVARDEEQEGRYRAQVCVSCPSDILLLECCQLRLELVRGDFLLSNVTTMLAHSRLADAVKELQAWAQPPRTPIQTSEFIGDLSEWLAFDSLVHLSEEGKSALINSAQAGVHPCMMPSLVAGAQRPGALSMMTEVGLDILRHLVSCGMAALSERVLTGLLAAPLHTPFSTIAHGSPLTPTPLSTTSNAETTAHAPSEPQSLLAYALMSNDEEMLARVLAWGHRYGEPGFFWSEAPPGRHTPADISMLRILRSLPDASALRASHTAHAMLCHLLSDPLAKPVTQRARVVLPATASSAEHAGAVEQAGALPRGVVAGAHVSPLQTSAQQQLQAALEQQQSSSHVRLKPSAQALPLQTSAQYQLQAALEQQEVPRAGSKPSLTEKAIALGQSECSKVKAEPASRAENAGAELQGASSSGPPKGSELRRSASNLTAAKPTDEGCAVRESNRNSSSRKSGRGSTGALSLASLGLVLGFGESGDVKESEYRCWLSDASTGVVKACCTGVTVYFWYLAIKSAFEGLLLNAIVFAMYPVPMALFLCAKQRRMRQASMVLASVFHVSYYILFGLGVLPSIVARKLALTHLDLIVEVVIFRLFQQVPLKFLLLERAAGTLGFALLYRQLSLPCPIIQAVAINLASFFVGIILEVRNRRIYLRIQNKDSSNPGATDKIGAQAAKKDK